MMLWFREVTMPGVLVRLSQFSEGSRRDEAGTRPLVLGQEGSEGNGLFQWVVWIFGVLARNKLH